MIISVLEKNAGFYSEIFFMLNHYIHCKNNKIPFVLDTTNWLFKYENGWEDYFENIDLNFEADDADDDVTATATPPKLTSRSKGAMQFFRHSQIIEHFSILQYKQEIRKIYKYNNNTAYFINQMRLQWGFSATTIYDSIFIRRGDKLFDESYFISTKKYIDTLLQREPATDKIVLQSDDYNCVVEAQQYLAATRPHIQLFSLCRPHNRGGMIIFPRNFAENFKHDINDNDNIKYDTSHKYISANLNNYATAKSVFEYSPAEIYEHTLDMICGVDFVLNSRTCVLDMQSNVSRFIRLFRDDDRVIDVVRLEQDAADFNGERDYYIHDAICPAYISSIYPEDYKILQENMQNII